MGCIIKFDTNKITKIIPLTKEKFEVYFGDDTHYKFYVYQYNNTNKFHLLNNNDNFVRQSHTDFSLSRKKFSFLIDNRLIYMEG